MPEYGVDTPDWQPLPWEWAAERLAVNRNYWVVTASGAGRPHALPVWGVWDDDVHRFCFSCGPSSRKARNIAANPAVASRAATRSSAFRSRGWRRSLPTTTSAGTAGSNGTSRSTNRVRISMAEFVRRHLVIEVVPDRAFGIVEREDEFSTRATRWRF